MNFKAMATKNSPNVTDAVKLEIKPKSANEGDQTYEPLNKGANNQSLTKDEHGYVTPRPVAGSQITATKAPKIEDTNFYYDIDYYDTVRNETHPYPGKLQSENKYDEPVACCCYRCLATRPRRITAVVLVAVVSFLIGAGVACGIYIITMPSNSGSSDSTMSTGNPLESVDWTRRPGATCRVQLRAVGLDDSDLDYNDVGHIAINGVKIFTSTHNTVSTPTTSYRGFNLVLFNRSTCTGYNHTTYDTCAPSDVTAENNRLVTYLTGLPQGNIILGVTSDEASLNLRQAAKETLKSLGVDVDTLGPRDKVVFIVEKGVKMIVAMRSARGQPHLEYERDFCPTTFN
jgi:hypothetical protein